MVYIFQDGFEQIVLCRQKFTKFCVQFLWPLPESQEKKETFEGRVRHKMGGNSRTLWILENAC